MVGMSANAPRERRIPGATLSLIAVAFSELRRDVDDLLDSRWAEPVRRRAEELSSVLAKACARQGLDDLEPILRAVHHLARLHKTSALPVLPALREKFDSLLRTIERQLPKRS